MILHKFVAIFVVAFFFSATYAHAQHIEYTIDDMTDEIIYSFIDSEGSQTLMVSENGDEGFILMPMFAETLGKQLAETLTLRTLSGTLVLDGVNCVEGGHILIRFENGERIQLNNFNRFDCERRFFFSVSRSDRNKLFAHPIDRIMIQDGRSNRRYTHTPSNPNFFIELGKAIREPFIQKD